MPRSLSTALQTQVSSTATKTAFLVELNLSSTIRLTEYYTNVNFDSNTLYVDSTNNRVGVGVSDPDHALDVVGTYRIASNATNSTNKLSRMLGRHYTNAEEDVNIFSVNCTSTTNALSFGGGSSDFNTATNIYFYTAAN